MGALKPGLAGASQCFGRNAVPLIPTTALAGPPSGAGASAGRIRWTPSILPRPAMPAFAVGRTFCSPPIGPPMARAGPPAGLARLVAAAGPASGKDGGTTLTCSPASAGTGAGRSARMPMALRDAGFKAGPPGARCRGELPGATDLMPAPFVLSDFTAPAAGRSARPSRAKLCCTETAAISATARAIRFNPDSFAAFCSSMIFSENRIPLLRIML